MKIVLAEAESTARSGWRTLAENVGIAAQDVVEAEDAASLLKIVGGADVSLLILAWNLPGRGGAALLGSILQERRRTDFPILAVGEAADIPALEASMMFGLTGYVTRPVEATELGRKIKVALFGENAVSPADGSNRTAVSTAPAEFELPFFMQLPSTVMDEFLRLSARNRFPAGATLVAAGRPVEALHVLTGGQAELREGEHPPRILDMGECFGEAAFLTEKMSKITVTASGPVEVHSLGRPGLAELLRRHPTLAAFLSALLTRRTQVRPGRPA